MDGKKLFVELFQSVAERNGLSGNEIQDLCTKLEGAIVLNVTNRLLDQLSEEAKMHLSQQRFPDGESIFTFLSTSVSQDVLRDVIGKATEEILLDFLKQLHE